MAITKDGEVRAGLQRPTETRALQGDPVNRVVECVAKGFQTGDDVSTELESPLETLPEQLKLSDIDHEWSMSNNIAHTFGTGQGKLKLIVEIQRSLLLLYCTRLHTVLSL